MNPTQQQIKDELSEKTNELVIANKELKYLLDEREKIYGELVQANANLAFENSEKERRAAELIVANKTLRFQNAEKEKRANELLVANQELAYQNLQKEISASELLSNNKELLTAQKQLKEVNQELEAFSYSVSHDLRAPLRAISGYSEILREDYSANLNNEGNRIIKVILDNTRMMGQLIDDLLMFSKMARLEMVSNSVNMKELVTSCLDQILQFREAEKYTIKIEELPACKGDAAMMKQVWYNLIDNAIKYSSKKAKPEITIGYTPDAGRDIYFIKDTGTGFDMRYAKNLFGVFQRMHRQDEFEGTGLGLALAKRIVVKHGGEIWADSALHEGSLFSFSIPKHKL